MIKQQTIRLEGDIALENGGLLRQPTIAFHTRGKPRSDGSNVVWVCHALTANSNFEEWWGGLFTEDGYFGKDDWFVICANVLGSCYGSTGPASLDPFTGEPYFYNFPKLTIRDLIAAHQALADVLGIGRIGHLIGGSLGGQQALQWAVLEPERFDHLIPIATNAVHSPWGIAFNESQRMAIEGDPSWGELSVNAGEDGLKVARSIALLSYRNYGTYHQTQQRKEGEALWKWKAKSYQIYQGEKLARRFNAMSYVALSHAMDSHDLGRNAAGGNIESALANIQAETLLVSMENDLLFPAAEQQFLARNIAESVYCLVETNYGHDGFLIETASISTIIHAFYASKIQSEKKSKTHY